MQEKTTMKLTFFLPATVNTYSWKTKFKFALMNISVYWQKANILYLLQFSLWIRFYSNLNSHFLLVHFTRLQIKLLNKTLFQFPTPRITPKLGVASILWLNFYLTKTRVLFNKFLDTWNHTNKHICGISLYLSKIPTFY